MAQFSLVRGRAMRATRLDGCGEPVLGPDSIVETEGFITVALTANNAAGETIEVVNANGNTCVLDKPIPKFVNWTIEITFCGVDPELFSMLTGHPLVMDADGLIPVGFRVDSDIDVDLLGFALELWTGVAGEACGASGEAQYGYLLLPFVKGGAIGNVTIENAAISFSLTGAESRDGSGWGVGPHDVTTDDTDLDGPLNEAVDTTTHLHLEIVTVAPPTDLDGGASALGIEATGATAGTPGTFTPANSYGPLDLAGMISETIVASPLTAWTTGQRVVTRDGSLVHWNSTTWVAGAA